MKCPRCGSPMILRRGRYGEFYGCSQYPMCDVTISLGELELHGLFKDSYYEEEEEEFLYGQCNICGTIGRLINGMCHECYNMQKKSNFRNEYYGTCMICGSVERLTDGICDRCSRIWKKKR